VPDEGLRRKSMGSQTRTARIPHKMLREIKVQIARWHQGGTPIPPHAALECVSQLEDLRGDRQTKNDRSPVCCHFQYCGDL